MRGKKTKGRYATTNLQQCDICGDHVGMRGFRNHYKSCEKEAEAKKQQRLAEQEMQENRKRARERAESMTQPEKKKPQASTPPTQESAQTDRTSAYVHVQFDLPVGEDTIQGNSMSDAAHESESRDQVPPLPGADMRSVDVTGPHSAPSPPAAHSSNNSKDLNVDDIKIEYHPHSRREPTTMNVEDYVRRAEEIDLGKYLNPEPWKLFGSLDNFIFAEWALESELNEKQLRTIINIINRVREGVSGLTFDSYEQVTDTWAVISESQPMSVRHEIAVPYKGKDRMFDVYSCSLLDYFLEQAANSILARQAEWHAMRIKKYDGVKWEAIYEEPITGQRAWDLESSILHDGTPFFIEIYADKSVLSSFGSATAYPVVARWSQLPHLVRNSNGLGTGRIIGLLPIIKKDAKENGKTGFTTFKNVVWHEGVWEMLKDLAAASHTGLADYEEQCTMALLRGLKCLFPCVVCDVPKDRMWDVTEPWGIRDPEKIKTILRNPSFNVTQKKEMTKHLGVRPAENTFWKFFNCNPHEALSFDRLHAFHGGLFGKHLLVLWQEVLENLGREEQAMVDKQAMLVPRFSSLYHFTSGVSDVTYTDGSKFKDLSKIIIHISHNVLTEKASPEGFQLLKTMRAFQILDTWIAFELHTEETLEEVKKAITRLETEIKALAKFFLDKNWQFPKGHSYAHVLRDILQKGVTRNYNTKPNEKLHGLLKNTYRNRTNFKNINAQLMKIEHHWLVATTIRGQLDAYDEHRAKLAEDSDFRRENPYRFRDIVLASRQHPTSLSDLEDQYKKDIGFCRFRIRLEEYLTLLLQSTSRVKLSPHHMITECRFIKLAFKSIVDWREKRHILHVADKFYNTKRNDAVLVRSADGKHFLALLQFVFACTLPSSDKPHAIAMVQALDACTGVIRCKDRALELIRLRAKDRRLCEFIPVESIIHGLLVVPAFDKEGDYMLSDVLDTDIRKRVHKGAGIMPVPPLPR